MKFSLTIPAGTETNQFLHNVHILKTWPEPFQKIADGLKTFEWRKKDRDYRLADFLVLREYYKDSDSYSNRVIVAMVTHILSGEFGVPEGYCVMSIKLMSDCFEADQ